MTPTTSPRRLKSGPPLLPGLILRRGLQIKLALHLARLGAQDALGHCAFQTERTADGKNFFTHRQPIGIAKEHACKFRRVLVVNLQQRDVLEFIDGDDLDVLVTLAFQLAVLLVINFHGNLGLALDDVKIGDEKTVFVDDEAGAEAARRAHLDDRFAQLIDQFTDILERRRRGGDLVNAAVGFDMRNVGAGSAPGVQGDGDGSHVPWAMSVFKIFSIWLRGMTNTV